MCVYVVQGNGIDSGMGIFSVNCDGTMATDAMRIELHLLWNCTIPKAIPFSKRNIIIVWDKDLTVLMLMLSNVIIL